MARSFNGTSDYGVTASAINLSAKTVISTFARIYVTTFDTADHCAIELTAATFSGATGGFVLSPNWNSGLALIGHAGNSAGWSLSTDGPTGTNGTWFTYGSIHNMAASGSELTYYRNGSSQSFTYGINDNCSTNFANDFLYVMSRAGTTNYLGGRICDIAIWDVALTATDYSNLNSGRRCNWTGLSAQPIYYWDITDGSGTAKVGGVNLSWTGGSAIADPAGLDAFDGDTVRRIINVRYGP